MSNVSGVQANPGQGQSPNQFSNLQSELLLAESLFSDRAFADQSAQGQVTYELAKDVLKVTPLSQQMRESSSSIAPTRANETWAVDGGLTVTPVSEQLYEANVGSPSAGNGQQAAQRSSGGKKRSGFMRILIPVITIFVPIIAPKVLPMVTGAVKQLANNVTRLVAPLMNQFAPVVDKVLPTVGSFFKRVADVAAQPENKG